MVPGRKPVVSSMGREGIVRGRCTLVSRLGLRQDEDISDLHLNLVALLRRQRSARCAAKEVR
jgi:hypothetical protein